MELKADRVTQLNCGQCGTQLDVSHVKPLGAITCPNCQKKMVVPANFGDFMLVGFLGRGATGIVCKALDQKLHRQVAIKILSGDEADKNIAEASQREARTLASINDPHVVAVHSIGSYRDQPYVVMELLSGGSAEKMLATGPLDEKRVLELAMDVTRGLAAAQRAGLVHMDVKPGNILTDREGHAKVIDFGIAQYTRKTNEQVVGTPYYVAPEVVRGATVDFKADMYSLGATLYHLLAGQPPYQGDNATKVITLRLSQKPKPLSEVRDGLHPETIGVIERLMQREPQNRYDSYDDLLADLRAAREAADQPVEVDPLAALAAGSAASPKSAAPAAVAGSITAGSASKSSANVPPAPPIKNKKKSLTPVFIAMGIAFVVLGGSLIAMLKQGDRPPVVIRKDGTKVTSPAQTAAATDAAAIALANAGKTPAPPTAFTAPDSKWVMLPISDAQSAGGATIKKLDDGSVFVGGDTPKIDTYIVTTTTKLNHIEAFGLEALPDQQLPRGGPGRQGNFIISSVHIDAAPKGEASKKHKVLLVKAEADYEQAGSPAASVIDDSESTGWGIAPEWGKAHTLMLYPAQPLLTDGETQLTFTIAHDPQFPAFLGRFRLFAIEKAPVAPKLPAPAVAAADLTPTPPPKPVAAAPSKSAPQPAPKPAAKPAAPKPAPAAPATASTSSGPPFKPIYNYAFSLTANPNAWHTLDVIDASSTGGAKFAKGADGSITVSGPESDADVYTITVKTRMKGITGFRLDALPDAKLPKGGPGRQGDFVLAKLTAATKPKDGAETPINFSQPTADVAADKYPPQDALDEDPTSGWAVGDDRLNKPHYMTVNLDQPIGDGTETLVTFGLAFHAKYALGKFLLSATTNVAPNTLKGNVTPLILTHTQRFVWLRPKELTSANGATLTVGTDATVLVSGKNVPGDTYTLTVDTPLSNITAVQLEILPDPSLPKKGPGRQLGGWSISKFECTVAPRNAPDKAEPVKFASALSRGDKKGNEVERALDGSGSTAWITTDKEGEKHVAAFIPDKPFGSPAGSTLTFTIQQKLNIGHFRLLATCVTDKAALQKIALPPPPEDPASKTLAFYYTFGPAKIKDAQGHEFTPIAAYSKTTPTGAVGGSLGSKPPTLSDPVFKAWWNDPSGFKATVPKGIYEVKLIFIEPDPKTLPGIRDFYIYVNGKPTTTRVYDINREAGGPGKPLTKTLGPITNTTGLIDLEFKGKGRVLSGVIITGKPAPTAPTPKK